MKNQNQDYKEERIDSKAKIKYTLCYKSIVFIFVYYTILLILGLLISSYIIVNTHYANKEDVILNMVVISLSVSAMFSAIKYTKIMYIACIRNQIESKQCKIKKTGNLVYFLLRPIFGMSFALITSVLILGGFIGLTGNLDCIINEKFVYLTAASSCLIGSSVGDVLDKLVEISKSKIKNFM